MIQVVTVGVWPRVFNAYYTSIIANVVMLITCFVASYFLPRKTGSLVNLTVWDRSPETETSSRPST